MQVWCEQTLFVDVEGDKILKAIADEKAKTEKAEAKVKASEDKAGKYTSNPHHTLIPMGCF